MFVSCILEVFKYVFVLFIVRIVIVAEWGELSIVTEIKKEQ